MENKATFLSDLAAVLLKDRGDMEGYLVCSCLARTFDLQ
jgi:hypothetical protein